MSNTVRELFKGAWRRGPSIERVHSAVRETTLVFLTFLTLLSLIVFWGELLATHDLPAESVWIITQSFNALAILFVLWMAAKLARFVRNLVLTVTQQ